jgi:chaperonin cofactor prefoldin
MGLSRAEVTKNLRKIRSLKLEVKKIDTRVEMLKSRAHYPGVKYSCLPKPPKGDNISIVHKYVEQMEKLAIDKLNLEDEIFELEKVFSGLDKLYYDIIYAKYSKGCNKPSWEDVSNKFGYSESHCRKYRTEAFKFLEEN